MQHPFEFAVSLFTMALFATLLAGCTTPSAAPSSPAPSSAQNRPSPAAAEEPVAAAVTIATESITITNDDGSVASSFTYFEVSEKVIAALTEAFGFEPTRAPIVPQYEVDPADADSVTWDGFVLIDLYAAAEQPYYPAFGVISQSPEVGEVTIKTEDGIAVGDAIDDLAAKYPRRTSTYTGTTSGVEYYTIKFGERFPPKDSLTPHHVRVQGAIGTTVTFMSAPNADRQ
ncbi:MAG: hypothetical protein H7226_06770 [Salinibacterium sp.]|nr:hypothetical protein [Salinibacterium sp.]